MAILISYILFIACLILVKPWRERTNPWYLVGILVFDALSLPTPWLSVQYFKIFSIIYLLFWWRSLFKKKLFFLFNVFFLSFLLFTMVIMALNFQEYSQLKVDAFSGMPLVIFVRHAFTLFCYGIFSVWLGASLAKFSKSKFANGLLVLLCISMFFVLIEIVFRVDTYHFLSQKRQLVYGDKLGDYLYERARGLFYEPRGLSSAVAILYCLIISFSKDYRVKIGAAVLTMTMLLISNSMSGFVIFGFLLAVLAIASFTTEFWREKRLFNFSILALFIFCFWANSFRPSTQGMFSHKKYMYRVTSEDKSLIGQMNNRLEIHDASYLNFLRQRPSFSLLGSGVGVGGFLSYKYKLEKDKHWYINGSSILPNMGVFYLLSQFGLIGSLVILLAVSGNAWIMRGRKYFYPLILISICFCFQHIYAIPIVFALIYAHIDSEVGEVDRWTYSSRWRELVEQAQIISGNAFLKKRPPL